MEANVFNIMPYVKSWDRNRRGKEICQVREKTVEEKGIVYGFKSDRTGKASTVNDLVSVELQWVSEWNTVSSFSPVHSNKSSN